jgi:hypothetical protein
LHFFSDHPGGPILPGLKPAVQFILIFFFQGGLIYH